MPKSFVQLFRFHPGDEGVGIIMRLEAGGPLSHLIYGRPNNTSNSIKLSSSSVSPLIPIFEKIRILCSIAKGLADIHEAGIIHGDIKPENIMLSGSTPPDIRIADFGMARLKHQQVAISMSSLITTTRLKGTPVYCAPEMLINPFHTEITVAQSSRKTDMYAFALLSWAVLAQGNIFISYQLPSPGYV